MSTPAPAFLFVGARAQVTVAETDDGFRSDRVDALLDGDVVIVKDLDDGDRWCETTDGARCGYVAPRHLSPVPLSPGPDQPTEAEQPWRQVGALVWTGRDGVVMAERPEDAARAVDAVNAEAGLHAEVQRLTEKVSELVQVAHDLCAERDAARAELDAATTDGHGLPHVKVTALQPHPMGAHYPVFVDGTYYTSLPNEDLRQASIYATAWALLRARLADEATPDDKEHDR